MMWQYFPFWNSSLIRETSQNIDLHCQFDGKEVTIRRFRKLFCNSYFCIRDQAYIYYISQLCGSRAIPWLILWCPHPLCDIVIKDPPPLIPYYWYIRHLSKATFLPWFCLQMFKISLYKETKKSITTWTPLIEGNEEMHSSKALLGLRTRCHSCQR